MIVATNQNPKNAIAIYLRRWEIESLFQSLKGRGFHFEQTHITANRSGSSGKGDGFTHNHFLLGP